VRNLVFGPFSLADGYYGETLSIDMTVYVPWSTPPCPTLTVATYVGEFGHVHLDSASFSASSYKNDACIYEVQRSATLSPDAVGLWYDEARARDKAVAIKVSFSHPASEVRIYRADISGRRFAENYIDKDVLQWQLLILRGFISQTPRYCSFARLPQVNYTAALINVATYSLARGIVADFLAVESPNDYGIKGVRFRVKHVGDSQVLLMCMSRGIDLRGFGRRLSTFISSGINLSRGVRGFGGCLSTRVLGGVYLRSLSGWRDPSACLKS